MEDPKTSARVEYCVRKPAGEHKPAGFPLLNSFLRQLKRFMPEQRKAHRIVFEKGFAASMNGNRRYSGDAPAPCWMRRIAAQNLQSMVRSKELR